MSKRVARKILRRVWCAALSVSALFANAGCNYSYFDPQTMSAMMGRGSVQSREPEQGPAPSPTSAPIPQQKGAPRPKPSGAPMSSQKPWPAPSPTVSPGVSPGSSPTPRPSDATLIGRGCNGDGLCLALKYVVFDDDAPAGEETGLDVESMPNDRLAFTKANLEQVNELWHPCGIEFEIDEWQQVQPEQQNLRYRTADFEELGEIRNRFMNDHTLLVVTTGPWDRSGSLGMSFANAWTSLPGESLLGAVLERTVSHDPNLVAHELGHYLSLGHVERPDRLMNPLIFAQSTRLSEAECESARWSIDTFWKKMLRASDVNLTSNSRY